MNPKVQLRRITNNPSSINGDYVVNGYDKSSQHDPQLHEAFDVFLTPRFLEDNNEGCLTPVRQALNLLPYIKEIDAQPMISISNRFPTNDFNKQFIPTKTISLLISTINH